MGSFAYENSDPERFQQLVQALLLSDFPSLQCFPVAQPDGGRDGVAQDGDLEGTIILQVKYKRADEPSADIADWMIAALTREKPKIERLVARGATRYIMTTNARATSHLDSGGIDRVQTWLRENLEIPAQCLWRDDLDRRLERNTALQWRYSEVLTGAGAVQLALASQITEDRERRATALRQFLTFQFDKDADVRFKQVDLRNGLFELFIDVPAVLSEGSGGGPALDDVVFNAYSRLPSATWGADEDVLAQSSPAGAAWPFTFGMADILLDGPVGDAFPRIVIEGAPGQGKSTLAQYVCQVHRARILNNDRAISSMPEHHRSAPIRFPIKVDLRDLATWLSGKDPFNPASAVVRGQWEPSLEAFLARLIEAGSGGVRFDVFDVSASLRSLPLLLFLDGLDEVAGVATREELVEAVQAGIGRLSASGVPVQVVVTSRPAAFAKSPGFSRREYAHFELLNLTRALVLDYANKWIAARSLDDADASDVQRILGSKLDLPHIRDIARNPMQLAILLSLIHAVGYSLPDQRTDLYASYMDRFLTREADKSPTVRKHRSLLVKIHQYLAWVLQSRAESASGLSGSVTPDELRVLIGEYLKAGEHPTEILDDLFTGVLERVFVLVQRIEGSYEFEVQPLREYFCATYLYETAPFEAPAAARPSGTRRERFEALSRNPYWTNVVRFYAGCYQSGELAGLFVQLEELRDDPAHGATFRPRQLGAMLLGDWVFKDAPRVTRHIADCVFDDLGLKAAAVQYGHNSAHAALELPNGCGRLELGERAFAALERNLASASADELCRLMRANMTRPLMDRILAATRGSSSGARADWLRVAAKTGVLENVDPALLAPLLCEDRPSEEQLTERCLAMARAVPRVAQGIALVVDRVLPFALRGQGPVELSPTTWYGALCSRLSPALLEYEIKRGAVGARAFRRAVKSEVLDSVPSDLGKVRQFLEADAEGGAGRSSSGEEETGGDSLSHASESIEAIRATFGEVWAARAMSIVAAGVPGPAGTRGEMVTSMYDPDVALLLRARRARYWTGRVEWWGAQLNLAQSDDDRMFWCALIMVWGKRDVFVRYAPTIASMVGELSESQYRDLYVAVVIGARQPGARSVLRARVRPSQKWPVRFDALLDECGPVRNGIESVGEAVDPIIQAVRDRRSFEAVASTSDADRDEAWLEAIRNLSPRIGNLRQRAALRKARISDAIARRVIAEPLDYPSELVLAAEDRLAGKVNLQPVLEVAAAGLWSFE